MKKTTKRGILAGALRGSSPVVAASVPIWLIAQKFPLWAVEQESSVSLTGAGVIAVLVAMIAFHKKIFKGIKTVAKKTKKFRGAVIGTIVLSMIVLAFCSAVRRVYPILSDIETICMGGVVSGVGGIGLEWVSLAVAPKKESESKEEKKDEKVEA